jgi:hypothetical protein
MSEDDVQEPLIDVFIRILGEHGYGILSADYLESLQARALAAEAQVAHYREALTIATRWATCMEVIHRLGEMRSGDVTEAQMREYQSAKEDIDGLEEELIAALSLPPTPTTDPPIQSTEADG